MAADAATIISELPPWLQVGANAALFVVTALGGIWALRRGHKVEAERDAEPFDAADLLESSPIKRFIASVETLADNAKLQTEAQSRISAAATALAKLVEEDFDERRVDREVERRLDRERRNRETRASPNFSQGAP